jgi:hypothetical protein
LAESAGSLGLSATTEIVTATLVVHAKAEIVAVAAAQAALPDPWAGSKVGSATINTYSPVCWAMAQVLN